MTAEKKTSKEIRRPPFPRYGRRKPLPFCECKGNGLRKRCFYLKMDFVSMSRSDVCPSVAFRSPSTGTSI